MTAGTSNNITWSYSGLSGDVTIDLYKGGVFDSNIATTSVTTGSYSWSLPAAQAEGTDYKVRIYQGSVEDYSNSSFTIAVAASAGGIIALSRSALRFGASGTATTSPQYIYLNNSDTGTTMDWAAVADQGWLTCTPTSGTDSDVLTVSVNTTGLSAGSYTGAITVSSASASNSPQIVNVSLDVYTAGNTEVPFGDFSTPTEGAIVSSSIPVTGWALDDVGVDSVKIYSGTTYIGDAVFSEGAREDLEIAYSNYPANQNGGWGYMLLTNFLPGGGNGYYTLNAIATDMEGNQTTLGSKNIIVDNANAVKPFGAIDAPGQGGAASDGTFVNTGWALTPMPNKIPVDGSTIEVFVNGVSVGHPQYNIPRSDIAAFFPGYANSAGPAARHTIDMTAYTNGIHTIYWVVSDDAGNIDGIGSRFFTVQLAGNVQAQAGGMRYRSLTSNGKELKNVPVDYSAAVGVKRGFAFNSEVQNVYPDNHGV
ncbi:MAG: hypothetical protein GY757_13655, partial [bacterium]|nr:hypothetical protein [bacterium]